MSPPSQSSRLEALLYGEGRWGAPEPELLGVLAPFLSEEQLKSAFQYALYALRTRAFDHLFLGTEVVHALDAVARRLPRDEGGHYLGPLELVFHLQPQPLARPVWDSAVDLAHTVEQWQRIEMEWLTPWRVDDLLGAAREASGDDQIALYAAALAWGNPSGTEIAEVAAFAEELPPIGQAVLLAWAAAAGPDLREEMERATLRAVYQSLAEPVSDLQLLMLASAGLSAPQNLRRELAEETKARVELVPAEKRAYGPIAEWLEHALPKLLPERVEWQQLERDLKSELDRSDQAIGQRLIGEYLDRLIERWGGAGPPAARPAGKRKRGAGNVIRRWRRSLRNRFRKSEGAGVEEGSGGGGMPHAEPPIDSDGPEPHEEAEPTAPPDPSQAGEGRTIGTGFARPKEPSLRLSPDMPLMPGTDYLFWFEIGDPVGSIERTPTTIGAEVPEGADLLVALFSFPGEIELAEGADTGEMRLQNGTAVVTRQPGTLERNGRSSHTTMLFPVRTPAGEGVIRMRCHIYHHRVLIQSRVVSVHVMSEPRSIENALVSDVDFVLAPGLYPAHVAEFVEHRLSILLNAGGDGTHTFRILGADEVERLKTDASFDSEEIQGAITSIRGALRKASWGNEEEWVETDEANLRYQAPEFRGDLMTDLLRLAIRGYRIYDLMAKRLAGNRDRAKLETIMARTGYVQVALTKFASYVLPAAAMYDYPIDTNAPAAQFTFCPAFETALDQPNDLEQVPCFDGQCPTRGNLTAICPSGFWGYRHWVGLPVNIGSAPDSPTVIEYDLKPAFAVGVSTDLDPVLWHKHELALQGVVPLGWEEHDDRASTLQMLKATRAQVVYFYCHGGLTEAAPRLPFILVGPKDGPGITRDNLGAYDVSWSKPRPLVFINGCHTAAISPEMALDLVGGFVETAQAAGVIGTEITIVEELATRFAYEFFRRFLRGDPVGKAMRAARLALLKERNPLGLVYIPFAMANLRLAKTD